VYIHHNCPENDDLSVSASVEFRLSLREVENTNKKVKKKLTMKPRREWLSRPAPEKSEGNKEGKGSQK
jgi:hypothetical protein